MTVTPAPTVIFTSPAPDEMALIAEPLGAETEPAARVTTFAPFTVVALIPSPCLEVTAPVE